MHDFLKKKINCCILHFAEVCFNERQMEKSCTLNMMQ